MHIHYVLPFHVCSDTGIWANDPLGTRAHQTPEHVVSDLPENSIWMRACCLSNIGQCFQIEIRRRSAKGDLKQLEGALWQQH